MKTKDNNDEFIRRLIRKKGPEKAPDHFTENLMSLIRSAPATDNSPLLPTGAWIGIIVGIAATIILIFMLDMPFLDTIFSSTGVQKVSMNIFSEGFINSLSAFFGSFKISGISVVIVIAASGLIVLERLLHRRFTETKMLMI